MALILNVTTDPLAVLTFGLVAKELDWPDINYVSLVTFGFLYGDIWAGCDSTTTASWSDCGATTTATWARYE